MSLLSLLRLRGRLTAWPFLSLLALLLLAACNVPFVMPSPTPEPTPAPTPGPVAETVTLYVAPETIPCPEAPEQTCLQVRESPEAAYQPLPADAIAGFEFEPGYEYELSVEKRAAAPDAAAYQLVTVVAKISPGAVAPGGTTTPLEGILWQLEALAGPDGNLQPALPQVKVTATFANGILGGHAGCNNYSAAYRLEGERLSVETIMTTMMACADDALNEQERLYLAALDAAAGYTIADGRLTLRNAAGADVLVFVAVPPASLTGTTWVLSYYHNGAEALVSSLAETQITLVFGEDGQVSGSAGCNTYQAPYQVEGANLTIAAPATTRMMCAEPAGIMEQENAYLQALTRAATYTIIGDELTLFDVEGMRVAGFVAGEAVTMAPGEVTPAPAATPTPGVVESTPAATLPPRTVEPGPTKTPTPGVVPPAPAATPTPALTLTDIIWQWVKSVAPDGSTLTVPTPERYTVTFLADGTLAIVADCNTGSGTYRREGANLSIGTIATTLMACPSDSLDTRFTAGLQQVTAYRLADGELILTLKDGGRMHFVAAATTAVSQAPTLALADTTWRWTALSTADGVTTNVNRPLRYTVSFLADGRLRLRLDCNQGRGTYQIEGNALSITATATTRRACGAGSAWQAFLDALNQAQSYEMADGNLIIRLSDGRALTLAPLR
ncbi:MAG: META domain-containing protein [Caldilineales bacterium]|nr:META domain-containing protein [Caldilineales bacterium]